MVVPLTDAVNWVEAPVCKAALVGEMETLTGVGVAAILTLALADLVVSATLRAVTVTDEPDGTAAGAV